MALTRSENKEINFTVEVFPIDGHKSTNIFTLMETSFYFTLQETSLYKSHERYLQYYGLFDLIKLEIMSESSLSQNGKTVSKSIKSRSNIQ